MILESGRTYRGNGKIPVLPRRQTDLVAFVGAYPLLALITLAGEIYSDAILTGGQVIPAAPDPIALAVGHATQSE